jgi:hypothetical protein
VDVSAVAKTFSYKVMLDPDGYGWLVTAEGYVARSLPYDTRDEAVEITEELVRRHPGSTMVVDEHAPPLAPIEIEHRLSP